MNPTDIAIDSNQVIEYLLNQIRLLSLQVAIADAKAFTLSAELEKVNLSVVELTTD